MPVCAYCMRNRELCKSHAIPNSFFKGIKRQNSGRLILLQDDQNDNCYSTNTGAAELLCNTCEAYFNKEFDAPIVNAFKAWDRKIIQYGFRTKFQFSANHITQALASIFWRACVSQSDFYENAKISVDAQKAILALIKGPQEEALKLSSCSISRLYDKRPASEGGFRQELFSNIVIPVNAYRASIGKSHKKQYLAFTIAVQGFVCTMTIPRLPFMKKNKPKYLKPNTSYLHAPLLHFLDYSPFESVAVSALKKTLEWAIKIVVNNHATGAASAPF